MDAKEKNKIKCREYYLKTKDNLSEEVKAKRKEQARIRALRYYYKNKELCKLRIKNTRIKKQIKKNEIKKNEIDLKIESFESFITEKEIKLIKQLNLTLVIKKAPRLTMWNKKISQWNFKDYQKLQSLLN